MSLSTLRKYKIITNIDLFQSTKQLEKVVNSDDFSTFTDVAEPIFYGISLANDENDLKKAQSEYKGFLKSHDLGEYADTFSVDKLSDLIVKAM